MLLASAAVTAHRPRTAVPFIILVILVRASIGLAADGSKPFEGIYIVPQSHIDVAWFWRYDPETIEVCIPLTFGRAADCLDTVPGFSFSASNVPLFDGMRRYHPDLTRRIEQHIRDGKFEVVGGHWVEFEGTGPCGEAMVRQCVYGKRWFKEVYGVDVRNGWQVDSWSHPWSLPQILRKCEIDTYVFKRGLRDENVFEWESADGSRVLAVRPFHLGRRFNDLAKVAEYHRDIQRKYGINYSMWLYGEGDHGGGNTREEIEKLKKQMADSPVPAKFSRADEFLGAMTALKKPDWPVLRDELGWELEGCHSNTCRLKAANRRCENLLMEAETFSSLAAGVTDAAYPKQALKSLWLDVLFNGFHDIIGGAVIPAGYEDAMSLYGRVESQSRQIRKSAMDKLCGEINTAAGHTRSASVPIVVFNPLSWARTGPVEAEISTNIQPAGVLVHDGVDPAVLGQIISVQNTGGSFQVRFVFVPHDAVPALGYRVFFVIPDPRKGPSETSASLTAADWQMQSKAFDIRLDPKTGDITRITSKPRNEPMLAEGGLGNEIQIIEETGSTEGDLKWGPGRWSPKPLEALNGWKVVESGPVRTTVRIRNNLPERAAVDRFITLYADPAVAWISFRTHFEWNGVDRMVKIAFATPYKQSRPTFDIPYGSISRPADGNERPAINWVDLSDADRGVSLLNDCRYGHDVRDGVIRIDALRSKTTKATHTEAGHQEVTYALYPHDGDWRAGRSTQRGYEFNHPLVAVPVTTHQGRLPLAASLVSIDADNVILTVAKQAEDSGHWIVRGYETEGKATTARLRLHHLTVGKAWLTNLLEKRTSALKVTPGDPTEVSVPVGAFEIVTVELEPPA